MSDFERFSVKYCMFLICAVFDGFDFLHIFNK